jgi:hypothetical protein
MRRVTLTWVPLGKLRGITYRVAIAGIALVTASIAGGCGGKGSDTTIVRVGKMAIDKTSVAHWADAIRLGNTVGAALGGLHGTPREKALSFLIASDWLIGEAADRGLVVTEGAVDRGLKERIEAVPNGRNEFEEEIASTGQTISDVKLEIRAALAAERLRTSISMRTPVVSRAEMANYYAANRTSFRVPEQRLVDLIENLASPTAAVALGRHLGVGARFAKRAIRELVPQQSPYEAAHRENHKLVHAIFAATPGEIGGPASYNSRWVLLVVRKIVPGSTKPFREVKDEIARRLASQRSGAALAGFIKEYRSKWTAMTNCDASFVVQKCSQYRGPLAPEGNPLAGG